MRQTVRTRTLVLIMMVVGCLLIPPMVMAQDNGEYVNSAGTLSFHYPNDWYLEEISDYVIIGTDVAAVDKFFDNSDYTSDEAILVVIAPNAMENIFSVASDTSPTEIIQTFLGEALTTIQAPSPSGKSIFYAENDDVDNPTDDMLVFGVDIGGEQSVIMITINAVGYREAFWDIYLGVAESLQNPLYAADRPETEVSDLMGLVFSAAQGTLTEFRPHLLRVMQASGAGGEGAGLGENHRHEQAGIAFDYPHDWLVNSAYDAFGFGENQDFFMLSNTQGAYERFVMNFDGLLVGDRVIIFIGPMLFDEATLDSEENSALEALDTYLYSSATVVATEPVELVVGGKTMAYVLLEEPTQSGLILAVEVAPHQHAIFLAVEGGIGLDEVEPLLQISSQIAASLQVPH